ncbi:hypothetical protein [Corynebacterium macginleyi]|uniref:hypothetical protein n=1 Tax=Corynebacterium macginleyi TaxID=38290 RepID=UPI00190DA079|nr:hypothetical protein [Corynebacterium macginleyi]MBK4183179.1 hypothetical protein [Corynebacterium macginleyi]
MTNRVRAINITDVKQAWRDYEIDVIFEISPGITTVISLSRAETEVLRDELNQYLGESNE